MHCLDTEASIESAHHPKGRRHRQVFKSEARKKAALLDTALKVLLGTGSPFKPAPKEGHFEDITKTP